MDCRKPWGTASAARRLQSGKPEDIPLLHFLPRARAGDLDPRRCSQSQPSRILDRAPEDHRLILEVIARPPVPLDERASLPASDLRVTRREAVSSSPSTFKAVDSRQSCDPIRTVAQIKSSARYLVSLCWRARVGSRGTDRLTRQGPDNEGTFRAVMSQRGYARPAPQWDAAGRAGLRRSDRRRDIIGPVTATWTESNSCHASAAIPPPPLSISGTRAFRMAIHRHGAEAHQESPHREHNDKH
jgi:hypothetical protein